MKNPILKRSVVIAGHPTSVSLEDPFWDEFQRICAKRKMTVGAMCAEIKDKRSYNLSSAIRCFVLEEVSS